MFHGTALLIADPTTKHRATHLPPFLGCENATFDTRLSPKTTPFAVPCGDHIFWVQSQAGHEYPKGSPHTHAVWHCALKLLHPLLPLETSYGQRGAAAISRDPTFNGSGVSAGGLHHIPSSFACGVVVAVTESPSLQIPIQRVLSRLEIRLPRQNADECSKNTAHLLATPTPSPFQIKPNGGSISRWIELY